MGYTSSWYTKENREASREHVLARGAKKTETKTPERPNDHFGGGAEEHLMGDVKDHFFERLDEKLWDAEERANGNSKELETLFQDGLHLQFKDPVLSARVERGLDRWRRAHKFMMHDAEWDKGLDVLLLETDF